MKRLKIDIKETNLKTGWKWVDYTLLAILVMIGLCLLPILTILWILGVACNLAFPNQCYDNENYWNDLKTNAKQSIRYKWANVDDIPNYIYHYFDTQPLMIFETQPKLDFFDGYFTDFKVERSDGVFIQKVMLDKGNEGIESLPLYFFDYATLEAQEVKNLKGYELDLKGNSDDFIISAYGDDDMLEIRLMKQ